MTNQPDKDRRADRPRDLARGAAAGATAAALSLGTAQLLSTFVSPASSPVLAVGSALIDLAPEPLKAFAIETFGTGDKLALLAGILVVLTAVAAVIGVVATRSLIAGLVGVMGFGLVGVIAVAARPTTGAGSAIPTLVGTGVGAISLAWLVGVSGRPTAWHRIRPGARPGRRDFLVRVVALGGVAIVSGGIGIVRVIRGTGEPTGGTTLGPNGIPRPASTAPPRPSGAELDVAGLSPFQTAVDDFYRVDTAIVPPVMDVSGWSLRVHGLVDRELRLDWQALVSRPTIERDITLACVSNQVGGPYVGTARWQGVPVADLLRDAGLRPAADQLLSRSIDGFSAGTPVAAVMDGRDAMLAIAMNGRPLAVEHGFPVRLLVPGLYGYASATKWLTELELTTFEAQDAYWVARGWATDGPILTMSRIDTPRPLATVGRGRIAVAGVAWAPHRGISQVEVRVDDGPWAEGTLAPAAGVDTWRQWVWPWDAVPGRHALSVRATDGSGARQPEARHEPFPSGATGWHTVVMTVS